ncbi:7996_t:CDS:2, partial [Cetraspora pellucida]
HSKDNFDITGYFEEFFHFTEDINDITKDIEGNLSFRVIVTTLDDTHNHNLSSKVIQFEKNKQFTDEMRKEIEFFVTKCHLNATMAIGHDNTAGTNRYNMPLSLFVIQNDNMQSCIVAQAFVRNELTKTYQWVLRMTKKAMNNRCPHVFVIDDDPAIERAITLEYQKTHYLFCIWHIKENIKKMLWSKLGDQFDEFYSKFWQCRNADTSLLIERSSEEQKRKEFEEWKRGIPSMVNTTTIFPTIESLVKCYLRVNVAHFLVEQMKESLYYTASHVIIEEIESLTSYESSQSEDIDDEFDVIILCATYLLKHLERTSIVEIWKISRVISHRINHFIFLLVDGLYSCTCLLQQRKRLVCHHFYHLLNITNKAQFSLQLIVPRWIPKQQRLDVHVWLQPFASEETKEIANDDFINEMLFYREVWGLAHTAVNKCMLYRDSKFVLLIEDYLNKIYASEKELTRVQEDMTSASTSQMKTQKLV